MKQSPGDEAIDSVAAAASQALRQVEVGLQLAASLGEDEQYCLDADIAKAPE